jgi:hypothetical protein
MRRAVGSLILLPILLLLLAPTVLAIPSSPFSGQWEATDPVDGSDLGADITGGARVRIVYTDAVASVACDGAPTLEFTSLLIGKVEGDEIHSTMRIGKCGTVPLAFLTGLEITWWLDDGGNGDPSDDILLNSLGEEFTRAA